MCVRTLEFFLLEDVEDFSFNLGKDDGLLIASSSACFSISWSSKLMRYERIDSAAARSKLSV